MIELDFAKGGGLIPAIAQDHLTGEVLMLAYINEEAWRETLATGYAVYYSRSRGELWKKGMTSGNMQIIRGISVDCDRDAVIFKVEQKGGAACHTGHRSCFFTHIGSNGEIRTDEDIVFDPRQVYGDREEN